MINTLQRLISSIRRSPVGWLLPGAVIVAVGFSTLGMFEQEPGAIRTPPSAASAGILPEPHGYTLVMALHPKCPCSRSGVAQLAHLIKEGRGMLHGLVLVFEPAGGGWEPTSSVKAAEAIPNVAVERDIGGVRAATLGAWTSGSCVLYDSSGEVRFWGGLTLGRGISGPAEGVHRIMEILSGAEGVRTAEVYGCPIIEPGDRATQQAADGCPLCGEAP